MSNTSKITIGIVAVIVIIGGGWLLFANHGSEGAQDNSAMATPSAEQGGTMQAAPSSDGSQVTSPTDTSDAAIDADTNNIDAQLNGLDTDTSNSAPGSDTTQ